MSSVCIEISLSIRTESVIRIGSSFRIMNGIHYELIVLLIFLIIRWCLLSISKTKFFFSKKKNSAIEKKLIFYIKGILDISDLIIILTSLA